MRGKRERGKWQWVKSWRDKWRRVKWWRVKAWRAKFWRASGGGASDVTVLFT
jgi:hypothetical protein